MSRTDKKAAITEYRRLYDGLNTLVMSWDPYGLASDGEIDDEFSHEVALVLARLPNCESASDVAVAIQSVFAKSFSEDQFPLSACEPIARIVYSWWSAQS
ncbi:MAG: DUF1871 family protein [Pseudomonas sp.]|nr:MAG: DUF1871 family protein [Pseudomonas sp.]